MKRDRVITVLLIIVGIVLAIALFSAGVRWSSGAVRRPRSLSLAHLVTSFFVARTGSGTTASSLCHELVRHGGPGEGHLPAMLG
jgi:hypothetical protein